MGVTQVYGDLGPRERAAFLAGLEEDARRRQWERAAVPPLTGVLARDLAAADEAVTRCEDAWEDARIEHLRLLAEAGLFPGAEAHRQVAAAGRRRDELWRLREKAVRRRDLLEAREAMLRDPRLGMPPGSADG